MEKPEELKLGVYEHFKGGLYEVIGVATHSETLEKMVVYKHLDEEGFWVRPYAMFTEILDIGGKKVPRFKKSKIIAVGKPAPKAYRNLFLLYALVSYSIFLTEGIGGFTPAELWSFTAAIAFFSILSAAFFVKWLAPR